MRQSGYDSTRPLIEKRAAGYDSSLDGYSNTSYLDMGEPYAAGSLYSSVDDLLIWDQALYGEKVLSAASKEKMFTPTLNNYGYAAGDPQGRYHYHRTRRRHQRFQHGHLARHRVEAFVRAAEQHGWRANCRKWWTGCARFSMGKKRRCRRPPRRRSFIRHGRRAESAR